MPIDFGVTKAFRPSPASEREIKAISQLELADYEIYSRKLELICMEGREMLMKMGVSSMFRHGDLTVGIYTANGDLTTSVIGTNVHLVSGQIGVKYILKYMTNDTTVGVHPGDMFYFNDIMYGGTHNPDQILLLPIFHDNELIAWAIGVGHETEVGAIEPGGFCSLAKSRYDEGMKLSPFKIGENYLLRSDLVEMLANMVRDPRMQTLDVKARAAVCLMINDRIQSIMAKKGPELVIGVMRKMIDDTSEGALQRIAQLNDGVYRQSVFIDACGHEKFGLIRCTATITKKGSRAVVDFTGTSPRVIDGCLNTRPHMMVAAVINYLTTFLFWDLKTSCGVFTPFDFVFPKGCFLDSEQDDAISQGIGTVGICLNSIHVPFEKMKFDSSYADCVVAPWGMAMAFVMAGVNQYGLPFANYDQGTLNACGMGGRMAQDGLDATGFVYCHIGDFAETEDLEIQYPVTPLFRNKFFADGHGIGKYRGGRAINVCYLVTNAPEMQAFTTGATTTNIPSAVGLFGGYASPARCSVVLKNKDAVRKVLEGPVDQIPYSLEEFLNHPLLKPHVDTRHCIHACEDFAEGEAYLCVSSGGAGLGDPLDREPELVQYDLKTGCTSAWAAWELHRVVIDTQTYEINYEETHKARLAYREERKRRGRPYQEFEKSWSAQKPTPELLKYFGVWPEAQVNPETFTM